MKLVTTAGALICAALLSTACGGATAQPAAQQDEDVAASIRITLEAADDLARSYGRKHLGHYLKLDAARLERAGLEIPDDLDLDVKTTHVSYCIKATSSALSGTHAWTISTIGSHTDGPSPDDRCGKRRY